MTLVDRLDGPRSVVLKPAQRYHALATPKHALAADHYPACVDLASEEDSMND